MTREEILGGVRETLASLSTAEADTIQKTDKIKSFVSPVRAFSLALEIDKRFTQVDLNDLANSLYDPISTVGELVDYIAKAYGVP